MTHLKLLTLLAALALLTACAGAVTIDNSTVNNNGEDSSTTDGTETTDGETNSAGQTPEQIEAKRLADLRAKLLTDETTACGGTCAGYTEWLVANPNLLTTPIVGTSLGTGNNTGHYLQGTATGLNSGGAVVTTVTFNDAFDDVDDNPFDGFAYFTGTEKRRYVGILSNTNLGAPLTTTSGRAIWKGFISAGKGIIREDDALTTPTAFNLAVVFNTTGGTINALIPTTVNSSIGFRILGEFDAGGVITGITDRRVYNDITDVSTYEPASRINTVGTLRGLIGSDGAVGVFTTDAEDVFVPYAGGFVARPDPLNPLEPSADHALYVSAFSPPLAGENLAQNTEETFEIAQPTAEGFSTTGLRFGERAGRNNDCNTCVNNFIVRLGGDNTDTADRNGFAVLYGRFTSGSSARLRAGLLPGTNVGATLGNVAFDGATTANWPGTIYHLRHLSGAKPNQVLVPYNVAFAVDFAAGTFELPSTVLTPDGVGSITIRVAGRFGSHAGAVDRAETPAPLPAGVLGGNAYHKTGLNSEVVHALQGLIGTEGAVAVFRSSTDQSTFGGLVARNAPVLVNHAVYLSQNTDLGLSTNTNSAFVRGLDDGSGLDKSNVNFVAMDSDGSVSSCASSNIKCIPEHILRLGGDNANTADPSGLAIFYGNRHATNVNAGGAYRVGLLSGTDVGNALPLLAPNGTARAEWSGKVHTTLDATGGTITPQDLTLTVDYNARTINGQASLTGGVLAIGGGYNQTGIMTGVGTVTYTPSSGTSVTFNLRGVIGTEGAIGIFQGAGSQHHVGGFIAKP